MDKSIFVVVKPLSRGRHTIRLYDEFASLDFTAGITINLTVGRSHHPPSLTLQRPGVSRGERSARVPQARRWWLSRPTDEPKSVVRAVRREPVPVSHRRRP